MGLIKSYGTYSSSGIQITSEANTVIKFDNPSPISALIFTNEGNKQLKISYKKL